MLFILILVISFVFQFFLPWWIIAPIAIGLSYWKASSGGHAFASGFGAIFLLWILVGLFHTIPNENLLANRVGQLLMMPQTSFNWIFVLLISGILGGLAAGFSALAGYYLRLALIKPATA